MGLFIPFYPQTGEFGWEGPESTSTKSKWSNLLESIPGLNQGVESQLELNTDMTCNSNFEFQICNLDLHPDYNKSKLAIWLLWCSDFIL